MITRMRDPFGGTVHRSSNGSPGRAPVGGRSLPHQGRDLPGRMVRRAGGVRSCGRPEEGCRITGTQRDKLATDLKKKYEKGASIRALAESTGRSYGFVHRVLSETGVTLRGRGGATRTRRSRASGPLAAGESRPGLRARCASRRAEAPVDGVLGMMRGGPRGGRADLGEARDRRADLALRPPVPAAAAGFLTLTVVTARRRRDPDPGRAGRGHDRRRAAARPRHLSGWPRASPRSPSSRRSSGSATRWYSSRIGEGLILDLRRAVFEHVQRMPVAFFTRTRTGALVSRLNNDVIGAQRAFTSALSGVVTNVIQLALDARRDAHPVVAGHACWRWCCCRSS